MTSSSAILVMCLSASCLLLGVFQLTDILVGVSTDGGWWMEQERDMGCPYSTLDSLAVTVTSALGTEMEYQQKHETQHEMLTLYC